MNGQFDLYKLCENPIWSLGDVKGNCAIRGPILIMQAKNKIINEPLKSNILGIQNRIQIYNGPVWCRGVCGFVAACLVSFAHDLI